MTTQFDFHAPTRVRFGPGVRWELPDLLVGVRWGILSSPTVLGRSGIAPVFEEARQRGIELHEVGTVSPNPRLSEVDTALARAAALGVEGVLAVGGGSVLDAGKLLRSALQHGVTAREALDDFARVSQTPVQRAVQLIAVPTTAGTGAEVSKGAIITDESTASKRAARGAELVPDRAVIDPELAVSLPARRTAETGFDVITHAVETYLSRAATPVTEILSLAALDIVPPALLRAVEDGRDTDARTALSLHAWLMGYNLAHSSTCLPHRMQYPVGAATDSSHQIGLAALYPSWIRAVRSAAPGRVATIMKHFRRGLMESSGTDVSIPDDSELMPWYLERLGIRVGLVDLGIQESDVGNLVAGVTGRMDLDPLDPTHQMVEQIFLESLTAG